MKKYLLIMSSILTILFILTACQYQSKNDNKKIMTVKASPLTTTLYYTGIIEPLKTVVVASNAGGTIDKMLFQYGNYVKLGQLLFIINSEKFQTDYTTNLMQYIKSKTDFYVKQNQLKEGEFLHNNQLISDDDFNTKKINFYDAQLAMLQSKE